MVHVLSGQWGKRVNGPDLRENEHGKSSIRVLPILASQQWRRLVGSCWFTLEAWCDVIKPEDDKYKAIVAMWSAGRGYIEICNALHTSQRTIDKVREMEGLPRHAVGPHTAPLCDRESTRGILAKYDGKCGSCNGPLPMNTTIPIVPKPGSTEALFPACKRCHEIYSMIRWDKTIATNFALYWNAWKPTDYDAEWEAEEQRKRDEL